MPDVYTVAEAAERLEELFRRAAAGEEIILQGPDDKRLRLAEEAASAAAPKVLPFGFMKGKIRLGPDFDAPLPDDMLKPLYGVGADEPWPDEEVHEAAAGHACRAVDAVGRSEA